MAETLKLGGRSIDKKWFALTSLAIGVFMSTLDTSIVNISLPALVHDLHTDFATVQWVVISYTMMLSSLILIAGRLGDMYDKRKIYIGGLALFTFGSLLCGLAPGIYWLIGFRALQGVGAMMMQAVGPAMTTEVFPAQERGRALGILGTVVSVGIAIGPPVGGILIGLAGWRSVFLVNIPIGILGLLFIPRFLPHSWPTQKNQRFDYLGALILFLTLGLYALGMTLGQNAGFSANWIQGLLFAAVIGLVVFIIWERRTQYSMVDITLFNNLLFSLSLLMAFLVFNVMGSSFILPFFLEYVKQYPAEFVGLLLMASPLLMGIVAPLAGGLSDRFGSRGISLLGLVVFVIGAFAMSTLHEGVSPLGFILRIAPTGIGLGLFQSPNNSAVMGSVPKERLGIASGLLSLSRTLGNASGLPLMGAIFYSQARSAASLPKGFDVASAPSYALTSGVNGTYRVAAFLVILATLLAVLAFIINARKQRMAVLDRFTETSKH
ncbi:MAG: MFS transporter [Anaerolineae bacterium]|nr:MFS transporter [Anaerolineae bacterium]